MWSQIFIRLIWSPNFICFALSLTDSEISANLCFFKFFKISFFFWNFEMWKNALLWSLTTHPQIWPISLYLLQFLSFKFYFWFCFTMATIRSVLTRFLQKTNQRQFKVYWLFLENFESFHTATIACIVVTIFFLKF